MGRGRRDACWFPGGVFSGGGGGGAPASVGAAVASGVFPSRWGHKKRIVYGGSPQSLSGIKNPLEGRGGTYGGHNWLRRHKKKGENWKSYEIWITGGSAPAKTMVMKNVFCFLSFPGWGPGRPKGFSGGGPGTEGDGREGTAPQPSPKNPRKATIGMRGIAGGGGGRLRWGLGFWGERGSQYHRRGDSGRGARSGGENSDRGDPARVLSLRRGGPDLRLPKTGGPSAWQISAHLVRVAGDGKKLP